MARVIINHHDTLNERVSLQVHYVCSPMIPALQNVYQVEEEEEDFT